MLLGGFTNWNKMWYKTRDTFRTASPLLKLQSNSTNITLHSLEWSSWPKISSILKTHVISFGETTEPSFVDNSHIYKKRRKPANRRNRSRKYIIWFFKKLQHWPDVWLQYFYYLKNETKFIKRRNTYHPAQMKQI